MKHLLSIADISRADAIKILDTATELARVSDTPMKKLPTLRGRTIVNLFAEDSTRTRISFEAAAKRLSADVINFSAKGSSVSKGESLKDTAQTLQAMGAEVRFAGFTLNTESTHSWFGCLLLVVTGFGLFELARRQYLHDWGESQEFIEKEVKRREASL